MTKTSDIILQELEIPKEEFKQKSVLTDSIVLFAVTELDAKIITVISMNKMIRCTLIVFQRSVKIKGHWR